MASKIAISLGQSYSMRQYQRVENGEFPKYKGEVVKAIDTILGTSVYDMIYDINVPREPVPPRNRDYQAHTENDFLHEYLESLKEQKRILEEQNQFLRRNFEISLSSIAEAQQIEIAHLKALSWYSAHVQAGENDQQTNKELAKINTRVGEFLQVTAKKDS